MNKRFITKVMTVAMMLVLVFTTVLTVPVTAEAAAKPTKITVSATKKTMGVGEKYTLSVKSVTPKNASKAVTYATSNKKVATVDKKGKITAKANGIATITVTSSVNKKVKATCKITVKKIGVSSIQVTNKEVVNNKAAVRQGKSLTLKVSVNPSNAANKKVTYKSSNTKVATVNNKGKITAKKKAGTAKITVTSADNKKKKVTITVTVPDKKKEVKSVKLFEGKKAITKKTLQIGGKFTLKPVIAPSNATVKVVTYKSSNEKVATVDSKGKVTAKSVGKATITVTTLDGSKTAKVAVTVDPILVSQVTISQTALSLNVGGTSALTATVAPANATNKAVTWSSSNAAVAAVDNTGKVTAKAAGTAVITVKAADKGGKSAACTVTVTNPVPPVPPVVPVTSVTLNKTSLTLALDEQWDLVATVNPENATDKTVTWTSSNPAVAAVTPKAGQPVATVKAVSAGTATITATAGGKSVTCAVTVTEAEIPEIPEIPVTSITLDKTSLTLALDGQEDLTATVNPEDATDKTVTWTSSDSAVATVTAKADEPVATVKAVSAGTATITATAGDKSVTCTVTVTEAEEPEIPVTSVTISGESRIYANQGGKLTAEVMPEDADDKTVTWSSSDETLLKVEEDGTLVPQMDKLLDEANDKDEVKVTVTAAAGSVQGTKEITIVLRTAAMTEDDYTYQYVLDKKAATYDVTRNNTTVAAMPESIDHDIKVLADVKWSNDTLKNNWGEEQISKALAKLVLFEELGLDGRIKYAIDPKTDVLTVSARNRSAEITRVDNANGTSSLVITSNGKTVTLKDITVTENGNEYVITTAAAAGATTVGLNIVIAKDASSAKVMRTYEDGKTPVSIITVNSNDESYTAVINKTMYNELLSMAGIADPITTTTVDNCYVTPFTK